LVHEDTFWSIFSSKQFREKSWMKIYLGQDPDPNLEPDPDPVKKMVRISNTASKANFRQNRISSHYDCPGSDLNHIIAHNIKKITLDKVFTQVKSKMH
jgi:hypothetical protein